jgi:hypothetical protein
MIRSEKRLLLVLILMFSFGEIVSGQVTSQASGLPADHCMPEST